MGPTTQVFHAVVEPPAFAAPMASGMAAEQVITWTINASDRFISVGPLDTGIFQDGDKVKILVQRIGKRKARNLNQE